MKGYISPLLISGLMTVSAAKGSEPVDVPVFITIGQSNADGSAYFDPDEDARLRDWYLSDANTGKMKIWYRSTQILNTENSLGEKARHVIDGAVQDAAPGWLDLWYRNENTGGRTAMNMIHGYGTYSTGTGTDCAQGRRGMEGEFGLRWATAFPDTELYLLKLGASGSFISSWADVRDDNNWNYFYNKIYRPAVEDLLRQGKRPRLAGVWWMQGCADASKNEAYYREHLEELVRRVREQLGFDGATVYVGHIVKPGENPDYPYSSVQFGQGVRDAQDNVAASDPAHVRIVDTSGFSFQDDCLHYDHYGVNAIGDILADSVIAAGWDNWAVYKTPGHWSVTDGQPLYTPTVGNPKITYAVEGKKVKAVLDYGTWTETVVMP